MIAFSDAELRDLFTLSIKTDGCQTRELSLSFTIGSADVQTTCSDVIVMV